MNERQQHGTARYQYRVAKVVKHNMVEEEYHVANQNLEPCIINTRGILNVRRRENCMEKQCRRWWEYRISMSGFIA